MRRSPKKQPTPEWEDAKFAVQEIGGWVKNADSKITTLAAVVGVTVTLFAAKSVEVAEVMRVEVGFHRDLVLVSAVFAFACLAVTTGFIVRALFPRYSSKSTQSVPNRFSWPELAMRDEYSVPDPHTAAQDAWTQARALSRIAGAKYRSFSWALGFFLVGVSSVVTCLGATAWLLAGR